MHKTGANFLRAPSEGYNISLSICEGCAFWKTKEPRYLDRNSRESDQIPLTGDQKSHFCLTRLFRYLLRSISTCMRVVLELFLMYW